MEMYTNNLILHSQSYILHSQSAAFSASIIS
ncbi:unknown [Bacteroides sp. CAG:598]|nr:unknown [Bacteroides sp. CAG:598]